jgi:hypothetical protein
MNRANEYDCFLRIGAKTVYLLNGQYSASIQSKDYLSISASNYLNGPYKAWTIQILRKTKQKTNSG